MLVARTSDLRTEEVKSNQTAGFFTKLSQSFSNNFIKENRWKLIASGLGVIIIISLLSAFFGTILGFGICMKIQLQIQVVVEEIYVNIAHYAYAPAAGDTVIRCGVEGSPKNVFIEFQDGGKPFNPLAKKDPDITLSSEERPIGGLGILMVKRMAICPLSAGFSRSA